MGLRRFYSGVVSHANAMLVLFAVAVILSLIAQPMVGVNYDINEYLPEDTASTIALKVMEREFDGGIPNARVMISGVSVAEALRYKQEL